MAASSAVVRELPHPQHSGKEILFTWKHSIQRLSVHETQKQEMYVWMERENLSNKILGDDGSAAAVDDRKKERKIGDNSTAISHGMLIFHILSLIYLRPSHERQLT